jgi:hypothetical protein
MNMSIARLTEAVRRAGEGIDEPCRVLISEIAEDYDGPPASTIRRIIREWTDDGVDLDGHRVRAEKSEGRLYLVIHPRVHDISRARRPAMSIPLYHQFGRVVSM